MGFFKHNPGEATSFIMIRLWLLIGLCAVLASGRHYHYEQSRRFIQPQAESYPEPHAELHYPYPEPHAEPHYPYPEPHSEPHYPHTVTNSVRHYPHPEPEPHSQPEPHSEPEPFPGPEAYPEPYAEPFAEPHAEPEPYQLIQPVLQHMQP